MSRKSNKRYGPPLQARVSESEYNAIMRAAKKHTNGNVSELIRLSVFQLCDPKDLKNTLSSAIMGKCLDSRHATKTKSA